VRGWRRVAVGLGVLALVALAALAWRIDAIAQDTVERAGSAALGVPTRLGLASVGFTPPGLRLRRLEVANPPGFTDPQFLTADALELAPDLRTLRDEVLVVPLVEVSGVDVALERRLTDTNYGRILDQLRRGAPPEPGEPGRKPSRRVRVDEILVRDVTARVRVGAPGLEVQPLSLRIPELRLRSGGQGTAHAVAAQVTRSLVSGVLAELVRRGELPAVLAGDLRNSLRGLVSTSLGRASEAASEGVRDAAEEAERALRGLSDRLRRD
jgi:hypothetical protein